MPDKTVLLEYRIPWWQIIMVWSIYLAIAMAGGSIISTLHFSHLIASILFGAFLGGFIAPLFVRIAYSVICTSESIVIGAPFGRKVSISLSDVKILKLGLLGVVRIDAVGVSRDILLPREVRDKLIAILRETSNARLIGFDIG